MGQNRILDFPFDIMWVAEKSGLLEGKVKYSGSEVMVQCLLEGCGDEATHLSINVSKGTWNCLHCGRGGGVVDLYAMTSGPVQLSRREATRKLFLLWEEEKGLSSEVKQQRAERRQKKLEQMRKSAPAEKVAPIERRDAAYRALLDYLPGLTDDHLANLRERGLSYSDIERIGFKSLVISSPQKKIVVPDSIDTHDVAGFYTYQGKRCVNTDLQGILIPYQNLYGQIGMLELRLFGGNIRYLRFSSGNPIKGRTECTKSVSTIHHVGIDLDNPPKKVYLTEGGLKADVANALTGLPFIAMAGVNNFAGLKEALEQLKQIGVSTIVLAFDMDQYKNKNVLNALKTTSEIIKKSGLKQKIMKWDTEYKGIDDYFWARFKYRAGLEI